MKRGYGWIQDDHDRRDHVAHPRLSLADVPLRADLTAGFPPCYDQLQLGSCTANAIAGALEYEQRKQRLPVVFTPSRLFIYYSERLIEGTIPFDAGARIRDGIKSINTVGAPHETLWPYDVTRFAEEPSKLAYDDGAQHEAVAYARVPQDIESLCSMIAISQPVVFGFTVFQSFETTQVAATGEVPMPSPGEQAVGGHAICLVGYDRPVARFKCRNSWGGSWGQSGYFTMPFAYVVDKRLASDFWAISKVE